MLLLGLLLLFFAGTTVARVRSCDESADIVFLCSNGYYDKSFSGTGDQPAVLNEKIVVYTIPEFNPIDKTVTIFMRLMTYWNDTRISLKTNDPNK